MLTEGALLFERRGPRHQAAAGRGQASGGACGAHRPGEKAARPGSPARGPVRPGAVPRGGRGPRPVPAARPGHQVSPDAGAGRPAAGALRRLVRVLPPLRGACRSTRWAAASPCRARSGPRPAALTAIAEMGFDVVYLPPDPSRSARPSARGATTRCRWPRGPRLTVGDRVARGRARRDPPRPGHDRGLRPPSSTRAPRAGPGGRARPRPAMPPPTTRGSRSTRSGSPPRRRHDRLRGEPAEEVPGHLPVNFDNDFDGHLQGDNCGIVRLLDGPRGADLPGRQPAHQADPASGTGCSPTSARPTRTSCSWPRPSPGPR